MSHRRNVWTMSAIAFVVFAAIAGAIIDHHDFAGLGLARQGDKGQAQPLGLVLGTDHNGKRHATPSS